MPWYIVDDLGSRGPMGVSVSNCTVAKVRRGSSLGSSIDGSGTSYVAKRVMICMDGSLLPL